jgi:hypothetical protein
MHTEPERFCIKCGLTDHDEEMVALYKHGEQDLGVTAWAHPKCVFEYRLAASTFERQCIELKLAERHAASKKRAP